MPPFFRKIRTALAQQWSSVTEDKGMSLIEHLEELRYRVIVVFLTLSGCFIALYPLSENLLVILSAPMREQLYMLAPTEAFVIYLKLALFGAIVISMPMTLYQAWTFIAPGLYAHEKKYAVPFVFLGSFLFIIGGYFCYRVVLPFGLAFLLDHSGGLIKPVISVKSYVAFVTWMILVFGAIFELPLVVIFLAKLGLVNPAMLRRGRRYAIVGAFILGAVLTPTPDIFTQSLLAGPLLVLYEVSIWGAVLVWKNPETEETSLQK